MKIRSPTRGFLVLDTVAGIALALVLLMMMTVAVIKQSRRECELADIRVAARAAEVAMLALESGTPLPAGATAQRLPADTLGGKVWARVTVHAGTKVSTLVGLVQPQALDGK